jgi:small subunit ribosomal protein S5
MENSVNTPNKPNVITTPSVTREKFERPERFDKEPKKALVAHICAIRRVSSVNAGGKTAKMSALVVVGDELGRIGFATGKASEVPEAVKKATRIAEKRMVKVPSFQSRTIHHDISAKHCSSLVYLRRAREGTGIIAGGTMRYVLEAAGFKDIVCKCIGSSDPINVVRATFKALQSLQTPTKIAKLRQVDRKSLFL